MSELIVDLFLSLDGSAHGTRSPGYFGYVGPDLERWIAEEQDQSRLDVMGRKTYEVLAGLPEQHRDESWERMTTRPTVLFSRTLRTVEWSGVRLCASDAVAEITKLKEGGEELRTVGSLSLVTQFLRAGLVDRLRVLQFPVIVGDTGEQRVLQEAGDMNLHLEKRSLLDERILLLEYRPDGLPPYLEPTGS
jgi:dihydrofolate reductase